jgi:hypothetical protein
MPNSDLACPHCKQSDKTYKVSFLYVESTARLNHRQVENQPELDGLLADLLDGSGGPRAQTQFLTRLAQALTPPQGEARRAARRVHPDAMVIFFTLLSSLIVYKVATTQAGQLPIILALLAGGILAYLLARKQVVRRYEEKARQEHAAQARLENAVSRWMHLYFCSRDRGVFLPEQNQLVPLERMSDLLNA